MVCDYLAHAVPGSVLGPHLAAFLGGKELIINMEQAAQPWVPRRSLRGHPALASGHRQTSRVPPLGRLGESKLSLHQSLKCLQKDAWAADGWAD